MIRNPLEINQILWAADIMRWNMINTVRTQSVAEHQYNVCMIARAMCKKANIGDITVTKAALEHDLDEVLFGDIPSPTKEMLKTKGVDINKLTEMRTRVLSPIELFILKSADLVDGVMFLQDNAVGKRAKWVCEDLKGKLVQHMSTAVTGEDPKVMFSLNNMAMRLINETDNK